MRICRYRDESGTSIGFYDESGVVPVAAATLAATKSDGSCSTENILDVLPPDGADSQTARHVASWLDRQPADTIKELRRPHDQVELLVPIPRPNKLLLLAGNYAKHIEEGGGTAVERAETFPYVFMKPPTTTLTSPGAAIEIPSVSPNHVDWELELAVVIGREAKGVSEAKALDYVAGYTIINDISDRKFKPNPERKERPKDDFFDWLHGKWHDSFCPCGPCITSADPIADPQQLGMKLSVNGDIRQDASTAQQIFPVAAVIEFISSFVTLEPGDIISTGTAAGVGDASKTYLKAGDQIEAMIDSIGTLVTKVV